MLDYCLDINENSYINVYTADSTALSFPFFLYEDGYFEANDKYYTIRSENPMYLLIYTVSGSGMVKVNDKTCYLSKGMAVLIDCRDLHEYRTISNVPWCFHYLHFDGHSMSTYKKMLLDEFDVCYIKDEMRFMKYIDKMHKNADQYNILMHNIHSSNLISELLTHLFESYLMMKTRGDIDSDAIRLACDYIEKGLTGKLTVKELSKLVHLSEYYFIRLFQRVMGVTPYQYIQILRINKAKELLISTEYPISMIASSVGYYSCTRFSRSFLEMTGLKPLQYRKRSYSFMKDEV